MVIKHPVLSKPHRCRKCGAPMRNVPGESMEGAFWQFLCTSRVCQHAKQIVRAETARGIGSSKIS